MPVTEDRISLTLPNAPEALVPKTVSSIPDGSMDVIELCPSPPPRLSLLRGRIRLLALSEGRERFGDGREMLGVEGIEGSENEPAALVSLPRGLDNSPEPPSVSFSAASGTPSSGGEEGLLSESLRRRLGVIESTEGILLFMRELVRPSKPPLGILGESMLGVVGAVDAGLAIEGTGEVGVEDADASLSASLWALLPVNRFFSLNMASF